MEANCGEIRRGKDVHLAKLRNLIRSPKPITKIDDVNNGITCFENAIAEYIDAGGERPSDQEMKSDLLDVLPGEVSVHVMWQVTDPTQSYHAFSNHIRSQANSIVYHQGRRRGAANLVDENQRDGNANMEDEVNAVYRKWGAQRPNGPKSTQENPKELKSTQVHSRIMNFEPKNSSQPKRTQRNSTQVLWPLGKLVNPSESKRTQMDPSQPKKTQRNSSQPKSNQ